jgi:hypothetical protein
MGYLANGFYRWGLFSASRPFTAIFIGAIVVALGTVGFINSQTTVSLSNSFNNFRLIRRNCGFRQLLALMLNKCISTENSAPFSESIQAGSHQ